ncbi:hypothetical protein [Staphylococcus simulans]|uniref:hypothetical protein n=2 Tax=Staphylococcus simulans TaxID=1286 RepID=UPI001304CDEC|nr:hypothetical protein [Staphylococcus simulans]
MKKMNKRDYYLNLIKKVERRIQFCEEELHATEESIKRKRQRLNELDEELITLEAVKEDIFNKLL